MRSRYVLGTAAWLSLAAAAFQVVISLIPSWGAFFGAPDDLVAKPGLLLAAGIGVALLLVVFSAFAASGAGIIPRLPFLRTTLLTIGVVFVVRGVALVPLLLASSGLRTGVEGAPPGGVASSFVALVLGILYMGGTVARWRVFADRAGGTT